MNANYHFHFEEPSQENLTTINQFLATHPCCNLSMDADVTLCHTIEYDHGKIINDNWQTGISEITLNESDEDTETHTWQIEQHVISDKVDPHDFISLWREQHSELIIRVMQATSFEADQKKTILILYHNR